jgi:hypothetical protein
MRIPIAALLTLLVSIPALAQQAKLTPERLHKIASDFYNWRNVNYPVSSSDQGLHTWDDRLTDYSTAAIAQRRAHVAKVATRVRNADPTKWNKDEAIDWLLFRSQVERSEFADRVQQPEETNPQIYVGEASNAIFSLIKKDYAPAQTRALAAEARFRAMPKLFEQGKRNLTRPVRLYSELAIDSARAIDPLFDESLDDDSGLHRAVHHSSVARGVQADQPGRVHESSGCLRQGQQRFLLHTDIQPAEP